MAQPWQRTLSMRCADLVLHSSTRLLPSLEELHHKKLSRFSFLSYFKILFLWCYPQSTLTWWHVTIFFTAHNTTIRTHVWDFHLQWHWSQVTIVVLVVVLGLKWLWNDWSILIFPWLKLCCNCSPSNSLLGSSVIFACRCPSLASSGAETYPSEQLC